MREVTKTLSKFKFINGLEVIKDCEGSKLEDSRFTRKFNKIVKINFPPLYKIFGKC